MHINALSAKDLPPIRRFEIEGLSEIVIIAGANGSGKTRLMQAIIETFRSPNSPQLDILLRSTRPDQEEDQWQKFE